MTWNRHVSISCDDDECGKSFFSYNTIEVFEAEREAIEEGWEEQKGEHYCPDCKDGRLYKYDHETRL